MTNPRYEIAKVVADSSFEELRDIATSLHDGADSAGLLQTTVDPINLVEFLYDWAIGVIEYEEEQAKETGE